MLICITDAKFARCEVLAPMFLRIQVYSDVTLCWRISGSQNFKVLYCPQLQEWQTPCNIKMLNRYTESHCRRFESKCKIVKLNHSVKKKPHTNRQKNQRYFKNFIRFSNVTQLFYQPLHLYKFIKFTP